MTTFKKIMIYSVVCIVVMVPLFTSAQVKGTTPEPNAPTQTTSGGAINIPNPLKNGVDDFMELVVLVLNKIIMPIAAIGIVIFIIYAGFMYVLAQGNETKIKAAHDRLLWGLIGGGIILGAAGISKVVETTVNQLIQ